MKIQICDHCGRVNPPTFPHKPNLTVCCSTTKDLAGNWIDPTKVFYTVDRQTSSIGKTMNVEMDMVYAKKKFKTKNYEYYYT